jgi:hypothetical protein
LRQPPPFRQRKRSFVRGALIILSAPEDARDARAEEEAEEEARTSRVRHLTPLIRQRSSGTRKSRTGSVTSPRPTSTWSRRADQRRMMMTTTTMTVAETTTIEREGGGGDVVVHAETHLRRHERPTRTGRSRLHAAEVQSLRG